ncbi:MAG: adenosylcobinamide-GDP ribazoletransferase [Gammaproteobacteria bacterium]|nr:adenosylcobinamide-GDP ribazoletransferase [Gammaproteobacteria bacterium]
MQQRLGGTTGDTAGALVEITEAAVLVTAALVW